MEETFYIKKIQEIKKNKKELEEKLNVKISTNKNQVTIKGETLDEFDARRVLEAIQLGFSAKKALLLKNENYDLKIINIKDHTRRNLSDVKARLIGKKGKTKRVFSETSGCEIIITDTQVGIIGDVLDVKDASTAVINLIRGSKQTNMYRFLEKQNKRKKEDTSFEDLPR